VAVVDSLNTVFKVILLSAGQSNEVEFPLGSCSSTNPCPGAQRQATSGSARVSGLRAACMGAVRPVSSVRQPLFYIVALDEGAYGGPLLRHGLATSSDPVSLLQHQTHFKVNRRADFAAMEHKKAFIVGISGCSSSGKTTLARLLRDIFPASFILHEDDFYKPENELVSLSSRWQMTAGRESWSNQVCAYRLPKRDGLVDWDSIASLSIPDMQTALTHIHSVGTFPVSQAHSWA
jgi:hypothetical protein